ncbi:hypothetical protein NLG97_g6824 [Lecanicillium saksenae]|uniref:Uncharacterized protein n=1 Tax=Lecanicillium saksenae TaxID=468837 RepID=A0ACC1QRQ6_9HYPO|nr:hypothetical protein NLG97_g6824 [Lecanicillium saksenae]
MAAPSNPSEPIPTASSKVSLREVTKDNWRAVIDLDMLDAQRGNVSSNARSLCESHYAEDAWVRAIYADETPVGFLMMSIWDPEEWYSIWRFMIDHRYQGLGYGATAMRLAIEHVRTNHPAAKLIRLMSASPEGKSERDHKPKVDAKHSPYKFYYKLGFRDIEPIDEYGEIEMGLDLQAAAVEK